jgi:GNAT superfamily N-acetyltransferase
MTALRAATLADVDAIAEVWHRCWRDGHWGHVPEALLPHRGLDSFRQRVPERLSSTTVAALDGRIVGFVTVLGDELEQLFVMDSARGTGTAVALIRHGERVIAEHSALAWLAAASGNARARRFYAREGWVDVGTFEYEAQVAHGTIGVPCHRYEKQLAR